MCLKWSHFFNFRHFTAITWSISQGLRWSEETNLNVLRIKVTFILYLIGFHTAGTAFATGKKWGNSRQPRDNHQIACDHSPDFSTAAFHILSRSKHVNSKAIFIKAARRDQENPRITSKQTWVPKLPQHSTLPIVLRNLRILLASLAEAELIPILSVYNLWYTDSSTHTFLDSWRSVLYKVQGGLYPKTYRASYHALSRPHLIACHSQYSAPKLRFWEQFTTQHSQPILETSILFSWR